MKESGRGPQIWEQTWVDVLMRGHPWREREGGDKLGAMRVAPSLIALCAVCLSCEGKSNVASPTTAAAAVEEIGSECVYDDADSTRACPHHDASEPAKPVDRDAGHFGAPFEVATTTSLSDAIATVDERAGAPVRVSGTITKVCKRKGCWMVVAEGDAMARVLFKDYGFTVPTDSQSRHAEVEGVLKTRTFTKKQARHLEEDGGGNPSAVKGAKTEYVLTATGVRISDRDS